MGSGEKQLAATLGARLAEAFRPAAALALLFGASLAQALPALPPRGSILLILVATAPIAWSRSRWRWPALVALGAAWALLRADLALSHRLPPTLQGDDLVIVGTVHGLPHPAEDGTRFEFSVERAERSAVDLGLRGLVRLSWYEEVPTITPCARWQLHVRLKRPRGLIDPGAFDFERYALEQGIIATGYVRADGGNRLLDDARWCIDRLRAQIGTTITETLGDGSSAHLLRALAFGDQRAMDEQEWAVARATGIPHLIAISGLHIALFASFGVGLMRAVWKLAPRLTLRWPAPLLEAVASLVCAVAYAFVAGFGLPTRRALVMIAALLVARLARRAYAPVQGLALAVIVLLVFDPLCVLSAGFWLSFVGVAWLLFCLGGARERVRWWRELVRAQGVASIGLLPLGIWFFGQSSLIAPLANLIAVPMICFCILPLTVVAALATLGLPALGAPLLVLAGAAMQALWWLLEHLAQWPGALVYFPEPSVLALALASLGAFWLLLPRGVPARALGGLLFLPLLWPARAPLADGEFAVDLLDVGQGLAVIVRTREHALVYDTGARFPSGFDLGDAAVVPALHALGVQKIDRLIVSHGDNDHAGGAAAVLAAFPAPLVESGEPDRLTSPAQLCLAGEAWEWNRVSFRIVHPAPPLAERANDRCCVLDVRTGDSELLLPGDVTAAVEPRIVSALGPLAPQLVVQVPHHGSKTSSSRRWVAALQPTLALISAGYLNRFHHPHPDVVDRYRASGATVLDTAQAGFVEIRFAPSAPPQLVSEGRSDRHPYWRE